MKVFLSHSRVDKDLARRLARDLQSANIDVWLDQWKIAVGEEFAQTIERGLEEAEFVIVLLTRASVASDWVNREWRRKVQDEAQTKRIAVIPVRGEPCEIPDFLAQRSHADISGSSYPLGFRHLLTILHYYFDETSIKTTEDRMGRQASTGMLPVVVPIALEVSKDLIPIFEPDSKGTSRFMDELLPWMRDSLHAEFGFLFPGVQVWGNETGMPPRSALISIEEVPEIMLEVGRDEVLVDGTIEGLARFGIKGERREDPVMGRDHARIAAADRAAAENAGLTTWDAAEYLCFALRAVLRRMAALFLDIDATRRLVDSIAHTEPELVAATVPKAVSWFELTDILQRLVHEEISVGDMGRILETLAQREPGVRDTSLLAEQVRHALSGQITAKFTRGRASLPVFLLDPEIDNLVSSSIQRTSSGSYLALEPGLAQDILAAIRRQVSLPGLSAAGVPVLVTLAEVRPYIRKLVALEFPWLHVLSPQDIAPETKIQAATQIRLGLESNDTTPVGRGLTL